MRKKINKHQLVWGIIIWILIFGITNWANHTDVQSTLIQVLVGPIILLLYYFFSKDNPKIDGEAISDERIQQRVKFFISSWSLPFLVFSLACTFILRYIFHIQAIPTPYLEIYFLLTSLAVLMSAAVIRRK